MMVSERKKPCVKNITAIQAEEKLQLKIQLLL